MENTIENLKNKTNKYDIMKILAEELLSLNYTYEDTKKAIQEYNRYFHIPLFIVDSGLENLEQIFYAILDKNNAVKLLNELLNKDMRLTSL